MINRIDELFDKSLAGKRIRLIHTDDEFTQLKSGDMGTVKYTYKNLDKIQVAVQWDSGSNLDMIFGVDQFEIKEGSE